MSEVKFTKGEWIINFYSPLKPKDLGCAKAYDIWAGEECIVGKTDLRLNCAVGKREKVANAHLIAAAPELYSELEFIRGYLQGNRAIEFKDRIDKLLARARGE